MIIKDVSSDKELKEIQKKLLKLTPLKLEYVPKSRLSKLKAKEALNEIFMFNRDHQTRYTKSNKLQCYSRRNRSQGDLYRVMRYYFPTLTFKTFRRALISLIEDMTISSIFCLDIAKRVYFLTSPDYDLSDEEMKNYHTFVYVQDEKDELNLSFSVIEDEERDWFGHIITDDDEKKERFY